MAGLNSERYRNWLSIDFSAFEAYAEKLDNLGADLGEVCAKAMEAGAREVEADVTAALADANLPAGGKYRRRPSRTDAQVIRNAKAERSGSLVSIAIGFDKTKRGAGTYLVTGTPKMRPDAQLRDIFILTNRGYALKIKRKIESEFKRALDSMTK